jgi:arginyl-tRNA synthetase
LSDRAIAVWLNFLLDEPLSLVASRSNPQLAPLSHCDRRIFAIQHVHARCCSLLRLADRERLIQLCSPEAQGIVWPFQHPVTIPWLDSNGHLHLQGLTERRLISQLFTVMESRSPQSAPLAPIQVLRLAEEVSQAFDAFHRDRPLLDRTRASSQEVIQARLGLVLATQRVLHCLLQQGLNHWAPQEL